MPRSGLPIKLHDVAVAVSIAAMAAVLVVTMICTTSSGFWEAHGGAGVEAEPSKPQDEKTDNCESQAMAGNCLWLSVFVIFSVTGSKYNSSGQSRPTSDRVNNGVAGKVHKTKVGQPAAAPYPVTYDRVNKEGQYEENTIKDIYFIRSATAPDTMVAAVPQKTSWKKNFPQKGTVDVKVSL